MSEIPQPPYAADTKSRGWRFEVDMERVRRSDTWSLAPADIRPWLLMMWAVSWEECPCGSLPDDDEVIAAKLGMPFKLFTKHARVLRRGWWKASDGRLYHATLTERVVSMLDKRVKDARRAQEARERRAASTTNHGDVTRDAHEIHAGVRPEFDTQHPAPREEIQPPPPDGGAPPSAPKPPPKPRAKPPEPPEGTDPQVWADWLALRRAKRAPVTATTVDEAQREASKAGLSLTDFLRVWCARGSQGLQADWLKPSERGASGGAPQWVQDRQAKAAEFLRPITGGRSAQRPDPNVIDMEDGNARLTLG